MEQRSPSVCVYTKVKSFSIGSMNETNAHCGYLVKSSAIDINDENSSSSSPLVPLFYSLTFKLNFHQFDIQRERGQGHWDHQMISIFLFIHSVYPLFIHSTIKICPFFHSNYPSPKNTHSSQEQGQGLPSYYSCHTFFHCLYLLILSFSRAATMALGAAEALAGLIKLR